MKTPVEVMGRRVANRLATAEDMANHNLRAHAELMQSMMDVRIDSEIAPYEGQLAVARVQSAMSKLVEAQADLAKAHKMLRSDFQKITMIPDDGERCPTEGLTEGMQAAA